MLASRRVSRTLLLIGFVAATGAGSLGCDGTSSPDPGSSPGPGPGPNPGPGPGPGATPPVTSQFELRKAMRQLWVEHAVWTRSVVVSAVAGLAGTDAALGRLLQNQADLGNAIKPFYGNQAGDALTALLREHINLAVELVGAAKGGDARKVADARARWGVNGDQIAAFLSGANPHWPLADLKVMMKMHLDLTLAAATARLTGDGAGAIASDDQVMHHILGLADALSDGITKQFPAKVSAETTLKPKHQELQLAMRAVWVDHVAWTRAYLVAAIAGLPETDATAARLMQNQTDIGKAIEPFYGKVAGDGLATLLREHIAIAAELVTAAKSGDADKVSDARTRWGKNADQLAAFLAAANPNWPLKDLTEMMRLHLDQTLTEATARLTGDWAGDIKAYDAAASHILMMADALSGGIARQFPGSVL